MASPELLASPEGKDSTTDPRTAAQLEKLRLEVIELKWKVRWAYKFGQLASVIVAVLAIAAFLWNLYQFRVQQEENALSDVRSHEREFKKPVWDRQLALFYELSEVTATIAALPKEDETRKRAEARFWVLYSGPSVFVEGKVEDEEHHPLLFGASDLAKPVTLVFKLRDDKDPLSQYLKTQFSPKVQQQLKDLQDDSPLLESLQKALVEELNRLLKGPSLFEEKRFEQVKLTEDTRSLIAQKPKDKELIRLNRLLLEEAYPDVITPDLKGEIAAFAYCLQGLSAECGDSLIEESRTIHLKKLSMDIAYKCRGLVGSIWNIKFSDYTPNTTTQDLP